MAMATGGGGGVQSSPNVTPMIDVMLVLLIIFMVVTPALLAGFNAQPPQAVNLKDHPTDDEVDQVLGIDKNGDYYYNKKPIKYDDIGPKLKSVYTGRDDHIMYLKSDKDVKYGKVIDVMDIATHSEVRMVGLISEQKPGTISTVEGDTKQTAPVGKAPGGL